MTLVTPSDLTSRTELSRAWAELTVEGFSRPDRDMERLYELATRDQWRVSEMDWEGMDIRTMPKPLRQAAANMFAQVHYGELAALLCTGRLVEMIPNLSAQLFCATQMNDEARHVRWFSRLMHELDCRGEVRPSIIELMHHVYESDTPEELTLGMQILIEGMAHSLFMEGARVLSLVDFESELFQPYRSFHTVVADWLVNYLARDESRHIAFGTRCLSEWIPELSVQRRVNLERRVEEWGTIVLESVRDPDLITAFGLDGNSVGNRCVRDLNGRLATAGLMVRLPELEGGDR